MCSHTFSTLLLRRKTYIKMARAPLIHSPDKKIPRSKGLILEDYLGYQGYCTTIIQSPCHPPAAESRMRDARDDRGTIRMCNLQGPSHTYPTAREQYQLAPLLVAPSRKSPNSTREVQYISRCSIPGCTLVALLAFTTLSLFASPAHCTLRHLAPFIYSHLHIKPKSMFARRACLLLFATPSASACRPVRHKYIHLYYRELSVPICCRIFWNDVCQGVLMQLRSNECEARSIPCLRGVPVLRGDWSGRPRPLIGGGTNTGK